MPTGMDRVRRQLDALPREIVTEVRRQLEVEAEKVVRAMKATAPKRTGALRDSIGWTWGDAPAGSLALMRSGSGPAGLFVTIYAGGGKGTARTQRRASGTAKRPRNARLAGSFTADNAKYQEFGTSRMPANPFFYPVWRSDRTRVRSNLTRAVTRAVRKANARR